RLTRQNDSPQLLLFFGRGLGPCGDCAENQPEGHEPVAHHARNLQRQGVLALYPGEARRTKVWMARRTEQVASWSARGQMCFPVVSASVSMAGTTLLEEGGA